MELNTVVVGGSQAGLAISRALKMRNVDHIVLERGKIGEGWRRRWDSFCLVTPNWSVQLPGFPYDGPDPDGFMLRDEIVGYLNRYASSFGCPVREGIEVTSVAGGDGTGFSVATTGGTFQCRNLVLATGAFQRPHLPAGAETFPSRVLAINLGEYRNPAALPDGAVLIIGSGQSGCQLAEELHQAGRRVVLACGRAPWAPRRTGDRDLVWWAIESGFLDATRESLPPEARLMANILATGHDGGHDLHLRTLRAMGVTLTGRFQGATDDKVRFAPDLSKSVAWGDERYDLYRGLVRQVCERDGKPLPDMPDPEPFDPAMPEEIDLAGFGTVIFTGGYRPDYASWLPFAGAFDEQGFPLQTDGASRAVPGLYFVGLHFLRKRKSALLYGVGEDAEIVADQIVRPMASR